MKAIKISIALIATLGLTQLEMKMAQPAHAYVRRLCHLSFYEWMTPAAELIPYATRMDSLSESARRSNRSCIHAAHERG